MRGANGVVLVFVGLIILWLAITEKYQCATLAFNCLAGDTPTDGEGELETLTPLPPKVGGGFMVPIIPKLPSPSVRTPNTFPGTRTIPEIFQLPQIR